jgi:hypothetical protein
MRLPSWLRRPEAACKAAARGAVRARGSRRDRVRRHQPGASTYVQFYRPPNGASDLLSYSHCVKDCMRLPSWLRRPEAACKAAARGAVRARGSRTDRVRRYQPGASTYVHLLPRASDRPTDRPRPGRASDLLSLTVWITLCIRRFHASWLFSEAGGSLQKHSKKGPGACPSRPGGWRVLPYKTSTK